MSFLPFILKIYTKNILEYRSTFYEFYLEIILY